MVAHAGLFPNAARVQRPDHLLRPRQAYLEPGSPTAVGDTDRATVPLDHRPDDREAQPGAGVVPARRVTASEAFEDGLPQRGLDAGTVVDDDEQRAGVVLPAHH